MSGRNYPPKVIYVSQNHYYNWQTHTFSKFWTCIWVHGTFLCATIGYISKLPLLEIIIFHISARTPNDIYKINYIYSDLISQWYLLPQTLKISSHTSAMIMYSVHIEIQHRNAVSWFNLPFHVYNVVAGCAAA